MNKTLFWVILAVVTCMQFVLASQESENLYDCLNKDNATLSSAYIDGYCTNKQLVNLNMEILRASDRFFQYVDKRINKCASVLLCLVLFRINQGACVALHEAGHALRFKAVGIDCEFGDSDGVISTRILDYYSKKCFFRCFTDLNGWCRPVSSGEIRKLTPEETTKILNNKDFNDFMIIMGAGGFNNQILFAERIGYDMWSRKQVDPLSYCIYLDQRFHVIKYDWDADDDFESNDPTLIVHSFKRNGRTDFKKNTIADAGRVSLFLSASTYSIIFGKPITLCGFRLPDVYPYITTRGISYKVVSGYEVNENTRLFFGFESVFENKCATEYSIGIDTIAKLHYMCIATFGLGLDLEASVTFPLSSCFSVGVGCEYYNFSSLQGQRNITEHIADNAESSNLNRDATSTNIFAFVSYRY
jgi:hypothetical protein